MKTIISSSGTLFLPILNDDQILGEPFSEIIGDTLKVTILLKAEKRKICKYCGSKNVVIKATVSTTINDSGSVALFKTRDDLVTKVEIRIYKRKYYCKDCGKYFTQRTTLVDPRKRLSNDLAWRINNEFKYRISFLQIAQKYNVDFNTVIDIFDKTIRVGRQPLTSIICIDEFCFKITKDNKYVCTISSYEQRRILDIVISRKKRY